MRLFIAEKPSVARAISEALGVKSKSKNFTVCSDGSYVTSCFGHLLELQQPDYYTPDSVPTGKNGKKLWRWDELPIIPVKWVKKQKTGAGERLKAIKELLAKAAVVVNAGDPDREGQNLVDEVLNKFGYKGKTERYWQSAMDQVSVKRALKSIVPNSTYKSWGIAAEARSRADWLIGMNLSRAVTLRQRSGLISVGRVQTPVLKLVADRDAAIENFKAHAFYNVIGLIDSEKGRFKARLAIPEKYLNAQGQLLDQAAALKLAGAIKGKKGTITALNLQHKSAKAPLAWTLTSLSAECSRQLGFSAKKTLDCVQKLYEEFKLASYPRSSCEYLPLAQLQDVPEILKNLKSVFPDLSKTIDRALLPENYQKSHVWNDEAVKKSAHTGIVPTLEKPTPAKLSSLDPDCRKVYEIIAKRYIAAFLPPCLYDQLNPAITLSDGSVLTASAKKITDLGWKAVSQGQKEEKDGKDDLLGEQILPPLRQGESVTVSGSEVKAGKTKPPARFTEGTLMLAMKNIAKEIDDPEEKKLLREDDGLGTEATRAQIIETLKARKFLIPKKGKLISTPTGREVLKAIPKALQSASLTAKTERELQKIQAGTLDLATFLETQKKELNLFMEEAKNAPAAASAKPRNHCPNCGKDNFWRNASKKNPGTFYWHCKDCNSYFDDDNGKPGKKHEPPVSVPCPQCKDGKVYRNESQFKKGSFYWRCAKCKTVFDDDNGKLGPVHVKKSNPNAYPSCECPHCHTGKAVRYPNKSDPKKFHWYCKDCQSSFWDNDGKIGDEKVKQ